MFSHSHHGNPFLPQAQSKAIVVNICRETFQHRNGKGGLIFNVQYHTVFIVLIQPNGADDLLVVIRPSTS